jgi:plastocyanin
MRPLVIVALSSALALSASGAAQPPDWGQAEARTIELSNFKYTPSDLSLRRGTPYRIHFVNNARGGHDFAAKQFFEDSEIAPEDAAKISDGSIKLEGHETADIRLVPKQAGTFRVRCTHFMHSAFGMRGTITVR